MFGRNKIAMMVAEFLGTSVLTMVVLSMVYAPRAGYPSFFVGLVVGVVVIAMSFALGRVSGAHFNPAITIGMWSARLIKTLPAIVYVAAQLLGGVTAFALFNYFTKGNFPELGKFDSHVLVAEAVGAFVFSFGWAATAYQKFEAGKAAATTGASLFVGIMIASVGSAALLNPAIALGVKSWVWGTYVLGPVLGAIIGFNLYALLFAPKEVLMQEGAAMMSETTAVMAEKPRMVKPAKSGKKRKK